MTSSVDRAADSDRRRRKAAANRIEAALDRTIGDLRKTLEEVEQLDR